MSDFGKPARTAPHSTREARALTQRALACELNGELENAVMLIERLRHPGPNASEPLVTPCTPVPV